MLRDAETDINDNGKAVGMDAGIGVSSNGILTTVCHYHFWCNPTTLLMAERRSRLSIAQRVRRELWSDLNNEYHVHFDGRRT